MRHKKTTLQKARDEADELLTPKIIELYPTCLLCGHPTEVAHHHIKKSESNRLRYHQSNLIPLCGKCHCNLHNHETLWSSRIVAIKGIEWFNELYKLKQETVKTDILFYKTAIDTILKWTKI